MMQVSSKLKKILDRDGYLRIKNILNFNKDLKPILNDMEYVMDNLVNKFAPRHMREKVFKYDFKRKYTYISKLNIYDLDQHFNTRLPRDNVKKDSDYFASQSLWNLINHKKILDVVEQLLGSEILSNPVQNTRIKQPESKLPRHSVHDGLSGRTPWHQDAAVLSSVGQRLTDMVTVWIPFTKTTKKPIFLEANVGDIIILHKHSIHCSLPNRSDDFRISADLRYNRAGTPSGRKPLPNFYVRSRNKKNITIHNYKQWISLWEKAKNKCIPRKYAFKYPLPTFKNSKRDLARLI